MVSQEVSIGEMMTRMILEEDLRPPSGDLMEARNQEITIPLLARLRKAFEKMQTPK